MKINIYIKTFSTFCLMVLLLFQTSTCKADTAISKVQALYLYNFAKYVKWSNVGTELKIGIYASSEDYSTIAAILSTRKVGNASIKVERLTKPDQAYGKHMIYASESYTSIFKKIKASGQTKNMLLVTGGDQISKGASISFIVMSSKLKFRINEEVCKNDGLSVSNNLVALGV